MRRIIICLLSITLLTTALAGAPSPTSAQANDLNAATQVLRLINRWRLDNGRWPLAVNPVLTQMALDQVLFILPFHENIEDYEGYHRDASGRTPLQRAVRPPYNWPVYNNKLVEAEIGENAGLGTFQFMMNFWQNSSIHSKAALSLVYREVGVAAVKIKTGFLVMVVFGARPNVLTAPIVKDQLYLTNELSKYSKLTAANTRVQVFDSKGNALTEPAAWTSTIPLPPDSAFPLAVVYTNGSMRSTAIVDRQRDVAILPDSPATISLEATPQVNIQIASAPSSTPTAAPTRRALPTNTPRRTQPSATVTPRTTTVVSRTATATRPVLTATSAATKAASAPTVAARDADLLILYGANSLTVFNNANRLLDLTTLRVGRLTAANWLQVAQFDVSAFPARDCLIVNVAGRSDVAPAQCRFVRAAIDVSPSRQFWVQGSFEVSLNDRLLATCVVGAQVCPVKIR